MHRSRICTSFRIYQLQEVRTAPAARGKGSWQEGPIGLRREGSGRAAGLSSGRWRPSVLILGVAPLGAGEALRDGRWDVAGGATSAHSLPARSMCALGRRRKCSVNRPGGPGQVRMVRGWETSPATSGLRRILPDWREPDRERSDHPGRSRRPRRSRQVPRGWNCQVKSGLLGSGAIVTKPEALTDNRRFEAKPMTQNFFELAIAS
jgi:hypothetical protein